MLSERLKDLRKNFNISQVELGAKIGVTKQCVSNWENDNILPSIDTLIKIARAFNVTTDYLLGIDSKKTINVDGLSDIEIAHLKMIIEDLKKGC